jgi:hypothetical protein
MEPNLNPQYLMTHHPKSLLSKYIEPKTIVTQTPEGFPLPQTTWVLSKKRIEELLLEINSIPIHVLREAVENGELEQYSPLEVGFIIQAMKAASTAPDALESLKFFTERILGKPKQQVESMNVNMSVKEYLETLDSSLFTESIPVQSDIQNSEFNDWIEDI